MFSLAGEAPRTGSRELGAAMIAEAVFQSGLGSIGEAAAKSFSR